MSDPAAALRVLIVGGGFTGAAIAYHLARRQGGRREIALTIVEPRERLGEGLAYSTTDPSHRINVPARRMSLSSEEPDGFVRWLARTGAAAGDGQATALGGELFPQRAVFGRYVGEHLAPFLAEGLVRHERAKAVEAQRSGDGFTVRLDDGRTLPADVLVLATTHPLPSIPAPLRALAAHARFHANPYDADRLAEIGEDEAVLIVGTGLTMADTVASLDRRGHRGSILALSRHGWRSRGHSSLPVEPAGDFSNQPARSVTTLFRRLRHELEAAASQGLPWQAVLDAVRRQGPQIWAALPPIERARLVRHGRTLWDVHRFRVAPQVDAAITRGLAGGQLQIVAASLVSGEATASGFDVAFRRRHRDDVETRAFDRVVITTGPGHRDIAEGDPLIASLVAAGELQPDALGLGLLASRDGEAIGRDGRARGDLIVAGPLARATFGELMGLPEVTIYAEHIAGRLALIAASAETSAFALRHAS